MQLSRATTGTLLPSPRVRQGGHAAFGRRRVKAARWRESGQNGKHEGKKKGKAHPGPLFICSKLIDHLAVPPDELLSDVGAVVKIPIIIPPPAPGPLDFAHCPHEAVEDRGVYAARFVFTLSTSEGCLA